MSPAPVSLRHAIEIVTYRRIDTLLHLALRYGVLFDFRWHGRATLTPLVRMSSATCWRASNAEIE